MTSSKLLLLLGCAATICVITAILVGSSSAGLATLADLLAGNPDQLEIDVLLQLRLNRALAAFGTGACLAMAGALLQVLLRNPLADPYILGTSGGAAVGALSTMILGGTGLLVDGAAFVGALGSTVLVFALARTPGEWRTTSLLLTGIVVAAGWGAVISLLLAISPETSLRGILFWLMGDFAFATTPLPVLTAGLLAVLGGIAGGRTLNVLGTGDRQATILGVEVERTRLTIYAVASLLTALAVTTAGIVGFVGLVVPHLVRIAGGNDHRILVPGSALAGGALLVIADTLARTLLAPRQLPVGAIMAFIGVPVFLVLLRSVARRDA